MKRPSWQAALSTTLLVALLGCSRHDESPARAADAAPVPVEVGLAEAQLAELAGAAPLTGAVKAHRSVSPSSKILGRIEQISVREGERVARGGVLARLENRDLAAAVAQAESAVAMAQAQLENATAQRQRMDALLERGSATPKNQEDAVAAFRVAEAGLAQAEANLVAARVTLGYSEITSPIAGFVVERHLEVGDMATPGRPLFVVEDLSRVEVEVQVPEARVVRLEPGGAAVVTVLDRRFEAEIARLLPAGDPASRTFTMELELDNDDGFLRSGMFARVSLAGESEPRLTVERSAIVSRGQLDGLFVVDAEGRLRLRWIKTGPREGERVVVLSGLEEGERYALSPPAGLVDGTPVLGHGGGAR